MLRDSLNLLVLALTMLLGGCSDGSIGDPVKINRLDLDLRDGKLEDTSFTSATAELFRLSGYGEMNDSTLSAYAANPSIRLHESAIDSVWDIARLDRLENSLGKLRINYNRLFPSGKFPAAYTIVSPFRQSVFTVDTLLFVGLNHYIGADYEPYAYFPDYVRCRKIPSRLAIDIAETIVRRDNPYQPSEDYPTLLSRMLYEGAVVEAVMQLAGVSEQDALGYNDSQFKWLSDNERKMWHTIVGQKYLFSTDPQTAASLINPAPFTSLIGQNAPGAAGRFIGHRIVNSYLDNHAVSIPDLLTTKFYESPTILADSKY